MKKRNFITGLTAILLVGTLFTSCEKEEEMQNPCDCYTLDENAPSNLRKIAIGYDAILIRECDGSSVDMRITAKEKDDLVYEGQMCR